MALFEILPYRAADASAVAGLFAATAEADPTVLPVGEEEWRRFTGRSFNRGARDFAVAWDGGRPVALLTSTRLSGTRPPVRHFRIVVHPDRRRSGIGTALLERVAGQDRAGKVALQCSCPGDWAAGRAFLAARGFHLARRHLEMARRGPPPEAVALPEGCQVRVGSAGGRDAAAWIRLDHEAYADDPDAQWIDDGDVAALSAEPGFRLWIAELRARPVGFCHAIASADGGGRIQSMAVGVAHRGRGLGRAQLVVALRALHAGAVAEVRLGVRAENAPAVGLYRSLGFEPVAEDTTWRRDPAATRSPSPAAR